MFLLMISHAFVGNGMKKWQNSNKSTIRIWAMHKRKLEGWKTKQNN